MLFLKLLKILIYWIPLFFLNKSKLYLSLKCIYNNPVIEKLYEELF